MKEKISGIYMIQSISKPERVYVGSSVKIIQRWRTHLSDLRLNRHQNQILQNHYNKYGKEDLEFSISEEGIYLDKKKLIDECIIGNIIKKEM